MYMHDCISSDRLWESMLRVYNIHDCVSRLQNHRRYKRRSTVSPCVQVLGNNLSQSSKIFVFPNHIAENTELSTQAKLAKQTTALEWLKNARPIKFQLNVVASDRPAAIPGIALLMHLSMCENGILGPCILCKCDLFTKTGSGQTPGNALKTMAFSQVEHGGTAVLRDRYILLLGR